MAISQAFREKLKSGMKNGFTGGGTGGKHMKWDDGQKRVTRLVPRLGGKDVVVCGEIHYNVTDTPTPCPGRGCPLNKALWDIKEEGRADAGELFKSYGSKPQGAWIAIDRADPERAPKIVSKGFNSKKKNGAADQMMAMFFDETDPNVELDPSDPENGFDIVMELSSDGTGYMLKAARANSPLAPTEVERNEIIAKGEALNLDAEFICTPEHMALLEAAAEKIRNGTLKPSKSKWGTKADSAGQAASGAQQTDTLAGAEAPATPPPSAPAAVPAAPPPASGAQSMAAKIRAQAEAAKTKAAA